MEKSPGSVLKLAQHSLVQLGNRVDPLLSSLILTAPSSFSAQGNYCQGTNSPPLGHLPHLTSHPPAICILTTGIHRLTSQTDFSGAGAGVRVG